MTIFYAVYNPVTIIATLWTLSRFQFQVSGDCSKDPPPIISESQLPLLSYAIVIDAGSSGSRVHVYNWVKQENFSSLPNFHHIHCWHTTPGVSSYKSYSEIRLHLLKLLSKAKQYVPSELRSKSPIYFLATAGMRLMMDDAAENETLYIRELLADSTINPFLLQSPEDSRILSGEEEGIFGWIAANYLTNSFTGNVLTKGILELGGASTQIAFVPGGNILANKYPVKIGRKKYDLYVHSYLVYGQEEVDRWTKKRIYDNANFYEIRRREVKDPCLLKGYAGDYVINGASVRFVGQGNPKKCLKLLDELVYKPNKAWLCNPRPCGIGNIYQPKLPSSANFYVLGAFVFPIKHMNILKADGSFSLRDLKEAANKFCSTSIDELSRKMSTTGSNLCKDCLTSLYLPILFEKAYGFNPDTQQLLIPSNTLDNNEIEWSVGAVIYEYQRRRCP